MSNLPFLGLGFLGCTPSFLTPMNPSKFISRVVEEEYYPQCMTFCTREGASETKHKIFYFPPIKKKLDEAV